MSTDFLFEYTDEVGRRLVIDDDGQTCYAYLLLPEDAGRSLVWLYNRAPTPLIWDEKAEVAPLNSAEFVVDGEFELPTEDDVAVEWHPEDRQVAIYIRGQLHAVLGDYEFVGRCVLAGRNGPVALTLDTPTPLRDGVLEREDRSLVHFAEGAYSNEIERSFQSYPNTNSN